MSESTRLPAPAGAAAYVDYEFAKRTGQVITKAGPQVSPEEAAEIVADLRAAAAEAVEPVAETSGMRAPDAAPPPLVVDRAGWIGANVDSFEAMLDPIIDKLTAKRKVNLGPTAAAIGSKVTGAEIGGLLAFLSSKILGQYDLAPGGTPRLLLVAPNIVQVERQLDVDPHDFRRWVAMHEETHRVQFTAVPWLREHMIRQSQQLAVDLAPTPEDIGNRLQQLANRLPEVIRSGEGLGQLFATPEQKAKIADITAIMSLLEGHADVVMDDVGPRVIPSVAEIRSKFDRRRMSSVGVDRLLRKLLGLEAKLRQYRDGAGFVRAVMDAVGREGLAAVWASPETLPRAPEILDPAAWVRRVHG
ncbi:coenzyme F420 biosynthesis protein [Intrasporangium chromatireducens Q5-1]|uniref:Coenzyme F420 biosynthesis protein n=1 Tax=Intrasporangium chromatireducens Q5-1 TaxID=584657 RepID=W9GRC8_9MICO|nr:zinc-dependent metalloprotease [Intrasporangium chromatireducens]EWT07388.1 coenzyme F420 biosynthesis protein [Intrasporangium chromatireducens Q5-1]